MGISSVGVADEASLRRRWETSDRYFEVRVQIDLFGQRVLTAINGGLGNRLGSCRVLAVNDEIEDAIRTIERRRLSHHYVEVV